MPSVKSDSIFKSDLFTGKVVFATGANSGGICSIQVEALMRHGCNAAIFGRRKELSIKAANDFEKKTGKKCLGLSGDVRDYDSLCKAVKETLDAFGRIDFVIAGAAGNFLSPVGSIDCSSRVWRY
jgi:peroxisomal 2,4-dienoyl-CoA reductase